MVYVLVAGLSIPGATILGLAAGAMFGFFVGTIVVSFASTLGATLAFLSSRYLFQEFIENKFEEQMKIINRGVNKDGVYYLISMRLMPIMPFFLINLLMGLTQIKTWTYMWGSQLGMLVGTMVYVNAGMQISKITTTSEVLTFELIFALALLGALPIIIKKLFKRV